MFENSYNRQDISLDQRLALESSVRRLAADYRGTFDVDLIEKYVHMSYDDMSRAARIPNHLPLLAERFAAQRLHALARLDGDRGDGRPIALFTCSSNADLSQMARGFFEKYADGRAVAWSGGPAPATEVNPAVIAAMAECDIDLTGEFPKPWTDEVVRAADVVITMGCGDSVPRFPGKLYDDWELAVLVPYDVASMRRTRDEVQRRVVQLLEGELGISVAKARDEAAS